MSDDVLQLGLLQVLRLKGRPTSADLAAATGIEQNRLDSALDRFVAEGHCTRTGERYRISKPGREHLEALLAEERGEVDQAALAEAYHEFDRHNSTFKQLITDWQLKDGIRPNDHSDADYDAAVVDRLGRLHEEFLPLVRRLVGLAARLAPYPDRFDHALGRVRAGEHAWLARPVTDSYHTVWFELHEDLIGLAGLSRADEAAAGRAD